MFFIYLKAGFYIMALICVTCLYPKNDFLFSFVALIDFDVLCSFLYKALHFTLEIFLFLCYNLTLFWEWCRLIMQDPMPIVINHWQKHQMKILCELTYMIFFFPFLFCIRFWYVVPMIYNLVCPYAVKLFLQTPLGWWFAAER